MVEGTNAKLEELQDWQLQKRDYNSVADEIDRLKVLKQKAFAESAECEGLKKRIDNFSEFQ